MVSSFAPPVGLGGGAPSAPVPSESARVGQRLLRYQQLMPFGGIGVRCLGLSLQASVMLQWAPLASYIPSAQVCPEAARGQTSTTWVFPSRQLIELSFWSSLRFTENLGKWE